ncbi:hydantoinase/oxoprolinase family protein [uncultured Clostridium sp.]|uniref:hydantoinase/oxoprolinase family protein n=1 Tax=uncultured Clostridium sp. TaxID=59620 RepID=UPI0025EFA4B2|nr:hydantoinase/oxoprolinase family protein [uncultured Clostridium sp.]
MSKYVCIDVGGTFTDAAVMENGVLRVFKSPTTPSDWSEGIINSMRVASEHYNESLKEFLESASPVNGGMITHGSTIATNAIVEKKCGKIGIICTDGYRDSFLWRDGEASTKGAFEMDIDFPEPFVPRYLTLGVKERFTAEGDEFFPLDEEQLREQVKILAGYNVEAIAVCFMWSVVNPAHEIRAREIIHEMYPDMLVKISSEVNPCIREYRRWISTALDASLTKLVSTYASQLNDKLRKEGFIGEIGMLNAYGGVMRTADIVERPLNSVDSGPAMAPIAGKKYALEDLKKDDVVILDMGGTTFDVSCVMKGNVSTTTESIVGNELPGISRVDVHSIGSGGGSIAWVDSGGMLRVGPRSAGAVPGPVCYKRGGIYPTVTDANVVLGYLNPTHFNDGRMVLDEEASYKAIKEHIADKLGISVYEAAFSIWVTVNTNMITAIKDITIWQGIDPRDFACISGGGATGAHALALAKGLDMKDLIIPKVAGGLSAVGGIFSDLISLYSKNKYIRTDEADYAGVNKILEELHKKCEKFFEDNDVEEDARNIEVFMNARYPNQIWELSVRIDGCFKDGIYKITQENIKLIEETFHKQHQQVFSVRDDTYVECIDWSMKAIGSRKIEERQKEEISIIESKEIDPRAIAEKRDCYFKKYRDKVPTDIYYGEYLVPGNQFNGPAIIEEPTTTIVILPGYHVSVTSNNNYQIKEL